MIISKNTIKKQIADLAWYIQEYRKNIDRLCDMAKEDGLIVYRNGDFVAIYSKDYTRPSLISDDLARMRGSIIGLQLAIDQLKKLL